MNILSGNIHWHKQHKRLMHRKRGKRDTENVKRELAKGMLRHCKYSTNMCEKRNAKSGGQEVVFLHRVAMPIIYAGDFAPP